FKGNGYYEKADSQGVVVDGNWHHIAICKYGSDVGIFVDGIPSAKMVARTGFPSPNKSQWRLGECMWIEGRHLAAQYARVRVSSICRYHARFIPEKTYPADKQSLMLQ